jgi:uncharacterized cupin superfamily protein
MTPELQPWSNRPVAEHVAHWDEIEPFRADEGAFQSTWTDLGRAAGSVTVGVKRVQVERGARSTPLHMEGSEEEIFFVLDGSGLSWQDDGDGETTYEIRGGDCLVHLAGAEAHSVVAGPEGIDYLAFGTRATPEYAFFPRLKAGRIGMLWADMIGTHQWTQELALGDPELPEPSARPQRIVNIAELEEEDWGRGDVLVHNRDLGIAAGSMLTGINYNRIEPGMLSAPPHCHSVEEEIFVILDGTGTALLGDEEHSLHRGHVVARPAGTRIPHAFRAGEGGLTMLAYGTRDRGADVVYYPRSNKTYFRGVGVMIRAESLDYWDGEDSSE